MKILFPTLILAGVVATTGCIRREIHVEPCRPPQIQVYQYQYGCRTVWVDELGRLVYDYDACTEYEYSK